jgi:hypothetical protein
MPDVHKVLDAMTTCPTTGIVMNSPPRNRPQKPPQNAPCLPEFNPVTNVVEADDFSSVWYPFRATGTEARELGIPMLTGDIPCDIDITIDGADEVDPSLNLINAS